MSIKLEKKKGPNFKKTKQTIPGQMLGQDRREKRSGEIPSPRQTSIDKTNDCAMKSERGALVTGAPTHPLVTTVVTKRPAVRGGRRSGV